MLPTMYRIPRTRTGFTIVELLVVIVVIAILAAITVTAYNGIQSRAKHAKTNSVASTYVKLLGSYYASNGKYPIDSYACLGEGNPDINADGSAGDCFYANSVKKENALMTTGLKTVTNSVLPRTDEIGVNGGVKFHGIVFVATNGITYNGSPWRYWITYNMEGSDATCDVRPLADATSSAFVTAPATRKYSGLIDNGVECWIPLEAS